MRAYVMCVCGCVRSVAVFAYDAKMPNILNCSLNWNELARVALARVVAATIVGSATFAVVVFNIAIAAGYVDEDITQIRILRRTCFILLPLC